MWDDAKALDGLAGTLAAMASVALLGAVGLWLARQPLFEIREVVVTTPLARASAPHLEAVIRDEVRGTFFTVDLAGARAAIAKVPWVRSVALRRQWRRLELAIEEHEPLAHLADGGLVNTLGEAFAAPYGGRLPRFSGSVDDASLMASRYREWSEVVAPLGLRITDVALSARGGWRIRTAGTEGSLSLELGRDDAGARLRRFVEAHARTVGALARRGVRIEHVDLRYRNGFAARVPEFRETASAKARG